MNKSNNLLLESFRSAYSIMFEVSDPKKPTNVSSFKRKLHAGSNTESSIFGKKFKTSKGNVVEVIFMPEMDSHEVVFTVNGSYDDNATKSNERDSEILSGVVYLMKKMADKLNIDRLTISPRTGKGDDRQVKGMDTDKPKKELETALKEFEILVNNTEYPTEPSEGIRKIWEDRGKDLSQWNGYDTYIKPIIREIDTIKDLLSRDLSPGHGEHFRGLKRSIRPYDRLNINSDNIEHALDEYGTALLSHQDNGVTVTKNRRGSVYNMLINRYMKEWASEIDTFGNITLERKK